MPWLRKKRDVANSEPDNPFTALRTQALDLDPAVVGVQPSAELPRVFGGVMDTAYPNGVATLVALADGTTSLYTSTGAGSLVAGRTSRSPARLLDSSPRSNVIWIDSDTTPDLICRSPGIVNIHALTYSGRRGVEAAEIDLGRGLNPLSPLFHAAHRVITALRLIDEQRRRGD